MIFVINVFSFSFYVQLQFFFQEQIRLFKLLLELDFSVINFVFTLA